MVTRYIVFIILIILGLIACGSNKKLLTIFVTIIYAVALLYYTFFSRMEIVPAAVAVGDYSSAPAVKTWKSVLKGIFVMQAYNRQQAFVLNILLFVPLGYLIPTFFKKLHLWQVVLTGLCSSFAIEILQKVTGCGVFDVRDIMANTIGAAIGGVMMTAMTRNKEASNQ